MQLLTEVSGLLASITGLLLWLPQGQRVWRDRHAPDRLAGISVPTQVLSLAGNVLWLVHAIGIGSFWLGAPSIVNVPIAIMTIVVVRRAARRVQPVGTPSASASASASGTPSGAASGAAAAGVVGGVPVGAVLLAASPPEPSLDVLPGMERAAVAVPVVEGSLDAEPDTDGLVLAS